jgi:hypothetical protein
VPGGGSFDPKTARPAAITAGRGKAQARQLRLILDEEGFNEKPVPTRGASNRTNTLLLRVSVTSAGSPFLYDGRIGRRVKVGQGRNERVCESPCDRPLAPEATYMVYGDFPASSEFSLPARTEAKLRVVPGNGTREATGIGILTLGIPASTAGLIMSSYGALAFCFFGCTGDPTVLEIGLPTLAVGAGTTVAGALLVDGSSTEVRVSQTGVRVLPWVSATGSGRSRTHVFGLQTLF